MVPTPEARKGKLRLDTREGAVASAVVPGQPERSEFMARLRHPDPEERMPPPDSGHELQPAEIETLAQWIAAGAEYQTHWAFVPPRGTEPPDIAGAPAEWTRNPIDGFVLARMRAAGLAPAPPRRPPARSPAASRSISSDSRPARRRSRLSPATRPPAATEVFVDRLLASPHFGEHWARVWLDLARYADTKGYEKDKPREIWAYRDWVIEAYNRDLPYDDFTRHQLAGDLLPEADDQSRLATAFHRNTMSNDEGGTDDEEFRVAAVKDRVDTTVQVWMGLTMSCAKCHSHKYDPIPLEEYYRFYAIFNQTEDNDRPDDQPRMNVPAPGHAARIAEAEAAWKALDERYRGPHPEWAEARAAWETGRPAPAWTPLAPIEPRAAHGTVLTAQPDHSVLASGPHPETNLYRLAIDIPAGATALRLEALTHPSMQRDGPGRLGRDPNYVVSEFELRDAGGQPVRLARARADYSQKNWNDHKAIDGKRDTGWAISGEFGKPHTLVVDLAEPAEAGRYELRLLQLYPKLQMGRFRVSASVQDPATLHPETGDDPDAAFLAQHPPARKLRAELDAARKRLDELRKHMASVPVMRELPPDRRRVTRVHERGNFLNQGHEVRPALPSAFAASIAAAETNRLTVAEWLVHPDNPLTARVAVNRVWARLFGLGLVETEEDFGTQGLPPTHPELLDWLAVEYRDTLGWSHKRLLKRIVLSATYQQAAGHAAGDPRNVWLSHGPRFRLSGEAVRDQALAVSGLLSREIGGPSVMPPQPDGVWKSTYSGLQWVNAEGPNRYRRGLYTYWKRTSPYPAMISFDAGSREVCLIRRIRTNTPLAALVTLNDPAFVEAAGALAQRMVDEGGGDPLARGFHLVLLREPDTNERATLDTLRAEAAAVFRDNPAAAKDLAAAAGLPVDSAAIAPWIAVANVLLNLDETLTKP